MDTSGLKSLWPQTGLGPWPRWGWRRQVSVLSQILVTLAKGRTCLSLSPQENYAFPALGTQAPLPLGLLTGLWVLG